MAFLRRQSKSGYWSLTWKVGRVQKSMKISRSKQVAQEALRRFTEQEERAKAGLGLSDLYIDEWRASYLERLAARVSLGDLAPSTLERASEVFAHLEAWLKAEHPGVRRLSQITTDMLRAYRVARRARKLPMWRQKAKARTINTEMLLLSPAFKSALRAGALLRNPLDGLTRLKEKDSEETGNITPEMARGILDNADERVKPYILAALLTGARRGELWACRWQDVDFKAGTVRLQNLKTARSGDSRYRTVPLHPRLAESLKKRRGLERPWPAVPAENLRRAFKGAVKAAGLPRSVRLHDLRHAFAGSLVSAGTDLLIVGKLLGHRDASTTLRYAHLAPEPLRRAVAKLPY